MRSYRYAALFAGAALAQENATVINLFETASTLTLLGSDASATTYQNGCPSESAGISIVPFYTYTASEDPTATPTITPAPTPRPLIRRQNDATKLVPGFCEPYTITQGSEVYGFHLTDPVPGAWTVDVVCNWQGDMSTANLTCDGTHTGFVPNESREFMFTSSVMSLRNLAGDNINVVAVVSEGATSSSVSSSLVSSSSTPASTISTPSEMGTNGLFGPDATAPSDSGSDASASTSSGFAAAGPAPTGAMAMVGGALGVVAAVMAL